MVPGSREARPRAPRRPGRRRSRLHGQEFVAGEDAVTVGVPAVEHADQPGTVAVLRVAEVTVAVGVEDVEGSALALPLRAGDAAVTVAVLAIEALVPGIVGH